MTTSVIVPMRDCAETLPRCLEALHDQRTREPLEIICVDNDSPDGAGEIARRAGVRVVHEPKPGAYRARNAGLRASTGSVVLFTDPDCVPRRDWAAKHRAALAGSNAWITLGRVDPPDSARIVRLLGPYDHARHTQLLSGSDPSRYFGFTNNLGARRELFTRLGPFAERRRGADTLLVQRSVRALGPDSVAYVPDAQVTHLEVATVGHWLLKMALYGRSSRRLAHQVETRPAGFGVRRRAFRSAIREAGFNSFESATLALLLAAGVVAWRVGRGTGVWLPGADPARLPLESATTVS
ncbi:MAG: glycosyltransferase [Gemmatimonadetes bacterium]|nr:glycosyltransferase [Gemmatimonadota bacterium]